MPDFYYEGISRQGEKIKGNLFAEDEVDLRMQLRQQKVRPIKIKEALIKKTKIKEKTYRKFSENEKLFFVKQIIVMLKSGLSIIETLDVLSVEGISLNVRNISFKLKNDIENGKTFAEALTNFSGYFDNLFLNLVASGELRGNLPEVLETWIDYFKKETQINKSVKKTITYPIAISIVVILAITIIVLGISPVFVHIYRTSNQALPLSLSIIVTISDLIKNNIFFIFALISMLASGIYFLAKNKLVNLSLDNIKLKLPFFSKYFKNVYTLKSILTLELALKNGLSLSRSLDLASDKVENHIFSDAILRAKEAVDKQEPMAPFLARSGYFKPMVCQILSVGENMNAIDSMLPELIEYQKEEVLKISSFLNSVLEPTILIVGGLLVGSILTSFFIPIMSLLNKG
jgi:type IV pilus assembly protein PilC